MSPRHSSQRQLLVALAAEPVDFVLIGPHAVAAHGYERGTGDVDIVYSTASDNCTRFAEALTRLDASIEMADLPAPGGRVTAEWLAAGGHFVFATVHGTLDALSWIAGRDFAALDSGAQSAELAARRRASRAGAGLRAGAQAPAREQRCPYC